VHRCIYSTETGRVVFLGSSGVQFVFTTWIASATYTGYVLQHIADLISVNCSKRIDSNSSKGKLLPQMLIISLTITRLIITVRQVDWQLCLLGAVISTS